MLMAVIVRLHCCTRKMLKETQTEKIIGFVSTFLSLVAFQLGAREPGIPGYAYGLLITVQVSSHANNKI